MTRSGVDDLRLSDVRRLLDLMCAARTVEELASIALPPLAATTVASGATMWMTDDAGRLRSVGGWAESAEFEPYLAWCRAAVLTRDCDPVRAAVDGGECWVAAASFAGFERASAFEACGFAGALLVPLLAGSDEIGVLEFATMTGAPPRDAVEAVGIVAAFTAQRAQLLAAEDAIAEADRLRKAMLERLADALVAMDRNGVITIFNRAAEEMFGLRQDEVIGKRVADVIVPPSFRPFHNAAVARVRDTGTDTGKVVGQRRRLAAMRPDGTQFPVDITVFDLDLHDGTAYGALIRDASAEADAEQALVESGQRFAEQARDLQRTFLPAGIPTIDGLDLAVRYVSAGADADIGGDFYDLFPLASGGWALALGDVQGKGLEAAAVMALARFAIRALATARSRPASILASLNDVLIADQTNRSCTLVYGRLARYKGGFELIFALAGHPRPLLVRDGDVRAVGHSDLLLGVRAGVDHVERRLRLLPGDLLLLYTDGLTEARSASGDFFGEQRLRDALLDWADLDAATIADRVERMALEFQGYNARDDLALIVIKVPVGGEV